MEGIAKAIFNKPYRVIENQKLYQVRLFLFFYFLYVFSLFFLCFN